MLEGSLDLETEIGVGVEWRPNTSNRFICRLGRVFVLLGAVTSVVVNELDLVLNLTRRRVPHGHSLGLAHTILAGDCRVAGFLLKNKLNVGVLRGNRLNLCREELSHAVGAAAPVAVLESDLLALEDSGR